MATETEEHFAVEIYDSSEHFLVAHVSEDATVIGIDHPTEADWDKVLAAHVALRNRLDERIAEMNKCPFKPKEIE